MNQKEKVLLYADNLWYLGEGMLGPLFAVFAESVGGSVLDITWAWATYLAVTGIFIMIFGRMSDGTRLKEKMLVAGYALNAVLTFGYLFVSTPTQLLLVQAGLGLAVAMATPTWNALYAKYQDRRHNGYLWGLADGQANLVTAAALVMGGMIINYFSFRALFVVMGCVQIVATAYTARLLRRD